MVDLVVWSAEVFWRRHIVDTASDVVSEREVWVGDKSMGSAEFFSVQPQNKPILEPKDKTRFKGQCTNLEEFILDLGKIASVKFAQTMK